ncbi:hypothetical protein C3F09_08465 [candidate division GN15 bacterium]|uniref:Outer membrane protein beta-barrel domain-containing protein n=1 Tax=candidate division GN15 bacterium TaxID=2072418 RepID=A0A855X4P5_9BACT|nr:MAG: hypothetical protein C3F09_08465 [candidate division GN15 bacterium]
MLSFRIAMLALLVTLAGDVATAAGRSASLYASAGVSSSVSMLGRYTNEGFGGMMAAGVRPFESSRDVVLTASLHYDRFANEVSGMGSFSFVRFGLGVRLYLDPARSSRAYLLLNVGPARVKVDPNSGFPPFNDAGRSTTNLFGAGGIGYELGVGKPVGVFMQAELVDILDTLFGDYRFVRLSFGLRL